MMQSHAVLLGLFAFFVSLVFAVLTKDDVREQVQFGATLFGGFVAAAGIIGWLMLLFQR